MSTDDQFRLGGQNFYEILEIDRTATNEEIKRKYQSLVRCLHPDKLGTSGNNSSDAENKSDRFLELQSAWSVLKDPELRKKYDAALICYEHTDLLLYETLDLFELEYDSGEEIYKYPCRCGGFYVVSKSDIAQPQVIVGCDECSFSILVNCSVS